MQAGASALSVLTDNHFFGGKSEDLTTARRYNFCPILRKDFIIDEYQIIEARSMGADAILLISEILTKEEVKSLTALKSILRESNCDVIFGKSLNSISSEPFS